MPRALGKLEDVAAKLSDAAPGDSTVAEPGTIATTLIWVLDPAGGRRIA